MDVLIINPMLFTAPLKGQPIKRIPSLNDTMIVNLCNGFSKIGCNITLIASEEYRPNNDEEYDFKIIFLENWISKYIKRFPHGLPLLKGLFEFLKNNTFDLIISSELFTPATITAAKLFPEKLIIWQEFGFHIPFLNEIPSKLWYSIIVKKYIKKKVLVVARSKPAQLFSRRYCNMVASEVINNCVNTDIFKPSIIKKDNLVILSRLIPGKNIDYIISQYLKFRKEYSDCNTKLTIIGDGPSRVMLENMVSSSPYKKDITFTGRLSQRQLAPILSTAKGFLCCTNSELNMISLTESICSGTPILSNCVPLQFQLIKEESLGIVKDNWDFKDIKKLLDNHQEYSKNCIIIRDKFSNIEIAKHFIEIASKYKIYESKESL